MRVFSCVYLCPWVIDVGCYTCRETVHLLVPDFPLSCFSLGLKGDSWRGKWTVRYNTSVANCVCLCVCGMPSKKSWQVYDSLSSPLLLLLFYPTMSHFLPSSSNNPLFCIYLWFRLEVQQSNGMMIALRIIALCLSVNGSDFELGKTLTLRGLWAMLLIKFTCI